MRWVLGPALGPITVPDPSTPPVGKTDLAATLVSASPTLVTLAFPAYDPNSVQPPAENRVYFLPAGMPMPGTAQDWVDSGLTPGVSTASIPVEGAPAYSITAPASPPADYLGQVIHGFAE